MSKPHIIQAEPEVPVEVLAEAIVVVATAARKLAASRLTDRAVELLIADAAGGKISRRDIRQVLDIAATLDMRYVKKAKAKT